MSEHELIRDYLDGRIGPDGLERLNQLLETDADARAEFRAMATLEEGLRDLSIASDVPYPTRPSNNAVAGLFEPGTPPASQRPATVRPRQRAEHVGIVALLLVCVGLVVLLLDNAEPKDQWGDVIARIEFLSDDIAFGADHQLPDTVGSTLGKGWVQIERGRIRCLFRSGATVEVEGPATLGIDTPMRAYLDYGKVIVNAPESGRDFVVATESMEVVDLGTRFEVSVDPQSLESNVSVIEGLVDLHLGSRGAERTIRPLEAGYAARVDASGRIVEITTGSGNSLENDTDGTRLLAHWTFDETGADGNVPDSSGSQIDGVFSRRTGLHPVPGRLETHPTLILGVSGNGVELDQDRFINLTEYVSTFGQLGDFTFAAWVRDPGWRLNVLFSLSGDSEEHRVQFHVTPRHIVYGWQDGLHYDSISGRVESWKAGHWYHVAVTVEGGVVRMYRDGELVASGSMGSKIGTPVSNPSLVKNASNAFLGRLEDGRQGERKAHQWFEGQMDDAQLYSGSLSQPGVRFIFEHPGIPWSPDKTAE